MHNAKGVVTFLLASALATSASLAQDARGGTAGGSSPTCSLLAGLEAEDARVFMQGYLVGRRGTLDSGSAQGGASGDGAAANANAAEMEPGPAGAASPVGGTPEPGSLSPNLEAPAEGNAENAGEAENEAGAEDAGAAAASENMGSSEATEFSLASLDALVDAAIAACQGSQDRPLFEIVDEADPDPRNPMNREPGLAGEGAPRPD